jgi:hypothetical protein
VGAGTVALYRAAPRGCPIRPGDFAADSAHEAGFYVHGGNVVQRMTVPRGDVFAVDGSSGGGREYVYLPRGYEAPEPVEHFTAFRDFFDAANDPQPSSGMRM